MIQVWPRTLVNFPIILIAIVHQYIAALALIWDANSHFATSVHILSLVFPYVILPGILIIAASTAVAGFQAKRKINTLLCLIPQQFLLYLSAGGSFEAIWQGQFADGTIRPHAFLLTDQDLVVLLAIFHTWAMFLILRYGADEE